MTNLVVFCISVLALVIGVTAAFGWPFGLMTGGSIAACVTLLATLKGK